MPNSSKQNTSTPLESTIENESRDRPEMSSKPENEVNNKSPHSSIFLPEKQAEGERLVKDFLGMERVYCRKLRCLKEVYYKELTKMAQIGRFKMSRKEVDEIFVRVPQLCEFHKAFYDDMSSEYNIGRIFVRLFSFFKRYVAYMKDCTAAINKMREHIKDTDLHACLDRVRERTMFSKEDMMDLLLVPLKRISEYSEFLKTLYKLADSSREADYEYLGKASRRIGRVAAYINKYIDGICNRNEMNKIQQFLGTQCDIINPFRRIVRRGMMIRRTSGWTARNKHYIFFLFNDIFLWTSIRGHLQNVIHLHNCEVLPSDAKLDSERKFRIISRGQRFKSLLLECENNQQRNEWYAAVESKIEAAKKLSSKAYEFQTNIETKNSDEEEEAKDSVGSMRKLALNNSDPVLSSNKRRQHSGQNRGENDEGRSSISSPPGSTYLDRYQRSYNFREGSFQNIEPLDDEVSVVSEPDSSYCENYKKYEDINSTTALMSPFRKPSVNPTDPWENAAKPELGVRLSHEELKAQSSTVEIKCEDSPKNNSSNGSNSPKVKILRAGVPLTPPGKLEKTSSYTIRLNHLIG